VIYQTVFIALVHANTNRGDGKDVGLWIGGMTVYGQCIIVANVLLAARFHNHNWISVTCLVLGCLAYIVSYAFLSAVVQIPEVNSIFAVNFSIGLVWLTIIFGNLFVYISEKWYLQMLKDAQVTVVKDPTPIPAVKIVDQNIQEDDASNQALLNKSTPNSQMSSQSNFGITTA